MPELSHSKIDPESASKSPLFTIGAHTLSHVPRRWERSATAPKKRPQRKGTKVWKRQVQEERDALVSAQLLNDLASSLEAHAAKRQRTGPVPAASVILRREAFYTPTLSDALGSARKRKPAVRRQSTRSSIKNSAKVDSWLSPTRLSTNLEGFPRLFANKTDDSATAADQIPSIINDEKISEASFLDLIDVSKSTIFDNKSSANEVREPETALDDEAVDLKEEGDEEIYSDVYDADADESSEISEDDEGESRLADAGNTGIVRVENTDEFDDLDLGLDDVQDKTQTSDMSPMQMHVASLLRSPPKVTEVMEDDVTVRSVSTESGTPKTTPNDSFDDNKPSKRTLKREDTTSTVAFEDLDVSGLLFGTEPSRPRSTSHVLSDVAIKQHTPDAAISTAAEPGDKPIYKNKLDLGNVSNTVTIKHEAESPPDEESADELDGGSPTQHRIIRSPKKEVITASVSPMKFGSMSHISDDTTYLNDFLSRVRSQAAARAQESVRSPVKLPTTQQSSRIVLGNLDPNSPSPSPVGHPRASSKKANLKRDYNADREIDSPTKLPKTPAARMLLASGSGSPETPDELSSAPPPPVMRSDLAEDNVSARRSGRSRLPAPSRLPANAPSNIPLRRADGEPPMLLRTEAQTLARTTAANTRRNKGGARFPKQVIEILDAKDLSPIKSKGAMKNRKGRNVDWDHKLVYFLEDTGKEVEIDADGKLIEKENGKEVKRKVRIVKGEKVVSEEGDAEDRREADHVKEEEPGHDRNVPKIAKASRRIKPVSTKSLSFELPGSSSAPAIEDTKPGLAKPRRARATPTLIGLKGTPAVRRMLSVEINTPILSAAKRRSRPT